MELRDFKEFNSFIDAVPLFKTKTQLSLWLFAIRNAKPVDINWQPKSLKELKERKEVVKAISVVDLGKVMELIARYRDKREGLKSKEKLDRLRHLEEALEGLKDKALFKMPVEVYKKSLKKIGFEYLLDRYDFEDREYIFLFPFENIDYGLNTAKFYFTERVSPLILEIKKWFTLLNIEEFLSLNSINSQILYRFLKRKLGVGQREFILKIELLNAVFNTKYKRFSDFKKKVLNSAIKEVNEKTSLFVEIEGIRKGKGGKLVAIKFKVSENYGDINILKFTKNRDFAKRWLSKVLNDLTKDLKLSYFELLNHLMDLRRVKISTALWYLLNFPDGEARLYAWRQIRTTDIDKEIKSPNKFLEKLISGNKFEFLKDERAEAVLNILLKKLQTKEVQSESESDKSLEEILFEEI